MTTAELLGYPASGIDLVPHAYKKSTLPPNYLPPPSRIVLKPKWLSKSLSSEPRRYNLIILIIAVSVYPNWRPMGLNMNCILNHMSLFRFRSWKGAMPGIAQESLLAALRETICGASKWNQGSQMQVPSLIYYLSNLNMKVKKKQHVFHSK